MALKVSPLTVFVLASVETLVWGHGYMIDPPSRNACYKEFPDKCPTNNNANEQFCGGRDVMISLGGKCGACGDKYGDKIHVYPGKYATGLITRKYAKGQEISVKIRITANHQGWFEFRVGDVGTPPITQAKFTYLLKTPDGKTRVPLRGYGSSLETIKLRLPAGLTCRQCVLQWWWKVGNSWGCEMVNGKRKCGLGYGPQETFVNCADIQIGDGGGLPPPPPTGAPPPPPPPTQEPPPPPPPTNPPNPDGCKATGPWTGNASIDAWCKTNCAVGNCPSNMCKC